MTGRIITRPEALEQGRKYYFTGKPCKNGHVDWRFVISCRCATCDKAYKARHRRNNRERENERCRVWYRKNKRRKSEYDANWYKNNKEKDYANWVRWRSENPLKVRLKGHRRRALVKNATDPEVTKADFLEWLEGQEKVCYWCNAKCGEKFHIDHYMPLAKGGKHHPDNLVIACPSCNLRKNAKDPYEFAAQLGRLF